MLNILNVASLVLYKSYRIRFRQLVLSRTNLLLCVKVAEWCSGQGQGAIDTLSSTPSSTNAIYTGACFDVVFFSAALRSWKGTIFGGTLDHEGRGQQSFDCTMTAEKSPQPSKYSGPRIHSNRRQSFRCNTEQVSKTSLCTTGKSCNQLCGWCKKIDTGPIAALWTCIPTRYN